MIREVYKDIYTFEVTLPNSPLRAINSYVIKAKDKNIVIDTGYNRLESRQDLLEGLKQLDIDIKDTSLILTHLHADHSGLTNLFSDNQVDIYAGEVDGKFINQMATGEYWDLIGSFKPLYGLYEDEITIEDNPGYNFKLDRPVEFKTLNFGDVIEIGDYAFEVIDLKGHTPGHLGLFDRKHKIMFSGDTVLDPITPNITFWGFDYDNILNTYMETLRELKKTDVDLLFASHRRVIDNHEERIDEILNHHQERLEEILLSMDDKPMTIRDISAKISWRIRADGWDDFPKPQKWFATGETMSHMEYLVLKEKVKMENIDGVLYFTKI